MIVRCLYDQLVAPKDLKPHPQNRNDHSKEQIIELAEILNYQGWRYPIKVSKQSGFITSGHGRLMAALLNKWTEVPVNFQDYDSPEQEYADVQADNAIALWAQMDFEKIREDLKSLKDVNPRMLGIKDFVIPSIPIELEDEEKEDSSENETESSSDEDDIIPEKIEPRVKPEESYQIGSHLLLNGDCLKRLKELESDSVDSLVTDPPAGISFMAKEWDDDKGGSKQWIEWLSSVMKECLRVMKPGSHGLVWAIPRTSHWTASALEAAGFEIRDVVTHIFGSGFPKSLDISKAIDKAAGATGASTSEAKQWEGWGTALKPASEHWVLIRKPCSEETVAKNVLKHGTGGLNIDKSRISFCGEAPSGSGNSSQGSVPGWGNGGSGSTTPSSGRFPANLLLSHNPDCIEVGMKKIKGSHGGGSSGIGSDMFAGGLISDTNQHVSEDGTETVASFECSPGCAIAELDRQSGNLGKSQGGNDRFRGGYHFKDSGPGKPTGFGDTGGASRFFYCAKPSKSEKNLGVEDKNFHPTVKSTKLMSYLIKMVTPSDGVILDCFGGSGTTMISAHLCHFDSILIEQSTEYCDIILARAEHMIQKSAVRSGQT